MNTTKGYFILADITGFTSFVAETELEHSRYIINQIVSLVLNKFEPLFTLAEVEGDAVFVYAPAEKFERSEIILEMIESSYFNFRDIKGTLRRITTCNCKACEMAPKLDLKFIVHSGDYILNDVAGKMKPLGNSINAAHRLLKNKVSETTGWKTYILFTEDFLKSSGINLEDFHLQTESFEHIGEIQTKSVDLEKKYKEFIENRRTFLSEENADTILQKTFSVSPQILWEWLHNPKKRVLWEIGADWSIWERPGGRTTAGASNHCTNSNFFEKLLDYRPFSYFTAELSRKKLMFTFTITGILKPNSGGTDFIYLIRMNGSLPRWLLKIMCNYFVKRLVKINERLEKLNSLLRQENNMLTKDLIYEN